jgi:hypothetical protein
MVPVPGEPSSVQVTAGSMPPLTADVSARPSQVRTFASAGETAIEGASPLVEAEPGSGSSSEDPHPAASHAKTRAGTAT